MHNINFIRDNPIIFDNFMKQRGELPCSKNIIKIDEDKRNTQTVLQNLLAERNKLSKEIGILKSQNKDVIIFCSGWKGLFNLEDAIYAGRLSRILLKKNNFYTICDSVLASISLSISAGEDLFTFLN